MINFHYHTTLFMTTFIELITDIFNIAGVLLKIYLNNLILSFVEQITPYLDILILNFMFIKRIFLIKYLDLMYSENYIIQCTVEFLMLIYISAIENFISILNFLSDYLDTLIVIIVIVFTLLAVAFMTIIERKQLAAHQRRLGPNLVGIYGIGQPFSDALKLILKETIIPAQANKIIFVLAPVSTLVFSLLGWGVIPFGQGLAISDLSMGILYSFALSSLGVYGILLSG